MERPSHIAFDNSHVARRLPLFALAAFLQVGAVTLIMTGLGHFTPIIESHLRLNPEILQPTIDKPAPPEPVMPKNIPSVVTPTVAPYEVDRGNTITVLPREPERPVTPTQPAPPDHGATAIMASHTQPPYPPVAIRQNMEGQVLLRLTVLESGRVGKADIVTSSGSDTLDQAAQAWIVAHWAYKPATDRGQAVTSQAMAAVTFNLKNAR